MKIIISEKQLHEILGVDSAYLDTSISADIVMDNSADKEIFVADKIDGKLPTPSTTDKISKKRVPRSFFGSPKYSLRCSKNRDSEILNEENKDLKDKTYTMPDQIYNILKSNLNTYSGNSDKGIRRLKNMVDMRSLTTGEMYRVRNKLNSLNKDSEEYKLIGGTKMLNWIDNQLKSAKDISQTSKEVKKDLGINNAFISSHNKEGKNGKAHTPKNGVTFTYEN